MVSETVGLLRERVAAFRLLEAEHRFGAGIGEPQVLPRIDGVPGGLYEVFELVGTIDTGFVRFETPAVVRSAEAWAERPEHDEGTWPVDAVSIGGEVGTVDTDGSVVFGHQVDVDLADGSVFHLSGDDFADWISWGMQGDPEIVRLAPDLPSFYSRYVFGPEYPELVSLICMGSPYSKRKSRYADPWMRLLVAAELIPPPESGRI